MNVLSMSLCRLQRGCRLSITRLSSWHIFLMMKGPRYKVSHVHYDSQSTQDTQQPKRFLAVPPRHHDLHMCTSWDSHWLTWHVHLCADEFPVYCLAVAGCVFSALLVDLKEVPSVPRIPGMPTVSWPYHIQNLKAVSDLHTGILTSCLEKGGVSQQCAYCTRCQASNPAGKSARSGLSRLKVRPWKAALLSSSFARHARQHFPYLFTRSSTTSVLEMTSSRALPMAHGP